jgi:hypothetical protein
MVVTRRKGMSPQLSAAGPWVLSAVGVLAAGALGATLALTGFIHSPTVDAPFTEAVVDSRVASASSCAGGPVVATLDAGQRVLVIERSVDAEWVGVRNPSRPGETLWLAQSVVTLDEAQSPTETLPTGGKCPTLTTDVGFASGASAAEAPDAIPESPGTTPNRPPAGDTASPQLSAPTAQPTTVGCSTGYPYPTSSLISVTAQDNVAVTRVDISWSGSYSGSSTMANSGSMWTFTFDATGPCDRGDVTFSMVALDAAGNRSAASTVSVFVDCLI